MSKISVKERTRPSYEVKDGDGEDGGGRTEYPELVKDVMKEVKAIGATSKENYDEAQKEFAALKKLVDDSEGKIDSLVKEEIKKISETITTRQVETDKVATKRLDEVEVAIKRMFKKGGASEQEEKIVKQAIEFKIHQLVAQGRMNADNELNIEELADVEELKGYTKLFKNYLRKGESRFTAEQQKQMSVGVDPDGGMLVTPVLSGRIIERIFESDPIRQLAGSESIGTDALEMQEDLDEASDAWETETQATSETTTPRLNKIRIPVHIQSARPRATQKFLDDASVNVEQWLARKVARKFGRTEGAAFVNGNGVGKPRGFLTYPTWAAEGVFEFGKIEQVNMGHATALTTDGFTQIMYALVEDLIGRGTWLMNRLTVRDTMKLKDGDGQYIWRPGIQAGQPSSILGAPLRMSTTMPTVAANALSVVFADFREAYLIVDRQGINVQRDPFTVKPLIEFYTRRRVGGDVVNFQAIKIGKIAA